MKKNYLHFDLLDSTNTYCLKNLHAFDKQAMTILSATAQTSGRGQFGKVWISPKEMNLYTSFCFFINEEAFPFSLTLLLASCCVSTLKEIAGIDAIIKKPNDLMTNGKKIGGILCETSPCERGYGVVIGLGLNVNMPQEELEKIGQPATSLLNETGKCWDIQSLIKDITDKFVTVIHSGSK